MNFSLSKKIKRDLYQYLRMFVSVSIYLLMILVALFIFYKVIFLFVYVIQFTFMEASNLLLVHDYVRSQTSIAFIENLLNNITFILILVKWFKILESYAKFHHISIKDLVEISIIALIMEVVFNFWVHTISINILFSVVGIALLVVYASMPYFRKNK